MDVVPQAQTEKSSAGSYQLVLLALRALPDRSVRDLGELAHRIGADKLELLSWGRADIEFARMLAAKVVP
jgi:hypothetical protein